jgi:hypothetical protein
MTHSEANHQSTQAASGDQVEDPSTLAQQNVQPESGALDSEEEKQVKRRHSMGTERVKHAEGEATEEA